jgi:hypothetical protein
MVTGISEVNSDEEPSPISVIGDAAAGRASKP